MKPRTGLFCSKIRRRFAFGAVAFAALAAFSSSTAAESEFPSRPIRLVVPFAAGGAPDTLARLIGPGLSEALGQPVVVENHPGAAGNIGTELVARSAPDGHVLLMATNSMTINFAMGVTRAPDPANAFAPVMKLVNIPVAIAVTPSLPVVTLADLVALARREPGRLAYANQGVGTTSHMAATLFSLRAGIEFLHVPYRSSGGVVADVMSAEVPVAFSSVPTLAPFVQRGQLRALAVTGSQRSPMLPDVPTVAESGYGGFEVKSWYGIVAPAGTPVATIAKLRRALALVVEKSSVPGRVADMGMEPVFNSPDEFGAEIAGDVARWSKVIREGRLRLE